MNLFDNSRGNQASNIPKVVRADHVLRGDEKARQGEKDIREQYEISVEKTYKEEEKENDAA